MAKHDTQLLKGILSMLLIRMLSTSEDYGYSVVVRLQESGFEGLTEGTVYPALTRLEAKGWLQSRLVPSDSGPARKYYRSTKAGDTELARATADWSEVVVNVERVMQASGVDLVDAHDHRKVTS